MCEISENDFSAWIAMNERLLKTTNERSLRKALESNIRLKGSKPDLLVKTAVENMKVFETIFEDISSFIEGTHLHEKLCPSLTEFAF
jgi:hypothetical protein